jgi:hypothetical protein
LVLRHAPGAQTAHSQKIPFSVMDVHVLSTGVFLKICVDLAKFRRSAVSPHAIKYMRAVCVTVPWCARRLPYR